MSLFVFPWWLSPFLELPVRWYGWGPLTAGKNRLPLPHWLCDLVHKIGSQFILVFVHWNLAVMIRLLAGSQLISVCAVTLFNKWLLGQELTAVTLSLYQFYLFQFISIYWSLAYQSHMRTSHLWFGSSLSALGQCAHFVWGQFFYFLDWVCLRYDFLLDFIIYYHWCIMQCPSLHVRSIVLCDCCL